MHLNPIYILLFSLIISAHNSSFDQPILLVAIFSAPENFDRREIIRRTWLRAKDSSINYKFIIGSTLCHINPADRSNEYDCIKRKEAVQIHDSVPNNISVTSNDCSAGFSFVTHYKLKVTHLGLPKCFSETLIRPVRIKLKGIDGQLLGSATFYIDSPIVKAIQPVIFPKYSEGIIEIDSNRSDRIHCCHRINVQNNAVTVTGAVQNSSIVPYNNITGFATSIFFTILENKASTEDSKRAWANTCEMTKEALTQEFLTHSDITFVNVTDVYRNLPDKLLHFIIKAHSMNFKFLMKTDDDTFIDLRRVMMTLRGFSQNPANLWWWSSFKELWHVPSLGKWREENYLSATYPPFPCGGGYVLSRGLVDYLASQAEHLQTFQGEDVSLGIWLAGVKKSMPNRTPCKNCHISYKGIMTGQCEQGCQWTCDTAPTNEVLTCNQVQLSKSEMYSLWDRYKRFGHLGS